jgi:hypothetical protein
VIFSRELLQPKGGEVELAEVEEEIFRQTWHAMLRVGSRGCSSIGLQIANDARGSRTSTAGIVSPPAWADANEKKTAPTRDSEAVSVEVQPSTYRLYRRGGSL